MSAAGDPDARTAELAGRLARLHTRLDTAVTEAGRERGSVTLLAVTKFFPADDVRALIALGCGDFGESREQEASAKHAELGGTDQPTPRWHMVGRIQRNKAAAVARWAHAAHSVDGERIAAALDRGVQRTLSEGDRDQPLLVFVQLSLDGDTARGGVAADDPDAVDRLCDQVAAAPGLQLAGLMAIPPRAADPDRSFAVLAGQRDRLQQRLGRPLQLSAGMSDDLEAAVRHGSTCVRVGTALLGPRPLRSP